MSDRLHITGSLGEADFPDLLQWLATTRQSGTLVVTHRPRNRRVQKRLGFAEGRITFTASTEPQEYLGHFLVLNGYLDEETLARAMEMQRTNRMLLGKILVTLGTIDERDLEAMLRLKAEEAIYEIFTWRGASFEFLPGELPELPMVPLSLGAAELVLEGARRVDEWDRIRAAIPSPQAVPVAIGEVVLPPEDPAAARVLSLVDDDRSIEDIALSSHASEFVVSRVLYEQVQAGRLKVVRPRLVSGVPTSGPRTEEQETAEGMLREALQLLKGSDLVGAVRRLRDAGDLRNAPPEVQLLASDTENRIRAELEGAGIRADAVPEVVIDLAQAASRGLSAHEGFLMSRIDGRYNVEAIVQITPLAPLETEVALWRLCAAGLVRIN
jgi:hypothetical protein